MFALAAGETFRKEKQKKNRTKAKTKMVRTWELVNCQNYNCITITVLVSRVRDPSCCGLGAIPTERH